MPQASDYTGTTFSPGQTILYSFNFSASSLWYIGGIYASRMTEAAYQAKVANAFAQWSAVANVTFQYTASISQADIGIYWHTTDGRGGTIGYALPLDSDGDGLIEHGSDAVLIGMDPYDADTFDKTILHEVGHALGLDHNSHTYSVMAPYYGSMAPSITTYDAQVVQSIYGAPGTSTSTTAVSSVYSGTAGNDVLIGSAQADVISGGSGADVLAGGEGGDLIYGNRETDAISGEGGNDTIFGGQNNGPADAGGIQRFGTESIYGGSGDDLLYGNMGGDVLVGGDGADSLFGGQDSDALSGGAGGDMLFGNLGSDQFHFGPANEGHDTIMGWGTGDQLALQGTSVSYAVTLTDRTRVILDSGTVIDIIGASPSDLAYSYT